MRIQELERLIQQALRRSWDVYKKGVFFQVPILEDCVKLYRYLRLTGRAFRRFARWDHIPEPEDMPWDDETEIVYYRVTGKRGLITAGLILLILGVSLINGFDSIKPKYRGSDITISQFAENYNHCLSIMNKDADIYDKLQSDGTKYIPSEALCIEGGRIHRSQASRRIS